MWPFSTKTSSVALPTQGAVLETPPKPKSQNNHLNNPLLYGRELRAKLERVRLKSPVPATQISKDAVEFANEVAETLGYNVLVDRIQRQEKSLESALAQAGIEPFSTESVIRYMIGVANASTVRYVKAQQDINNFVDSFWVTQVRYGIYERSFRGDWRSSEEFTKEVTDFLLNFRQNAAKNVELKWESLPLQEYVGNVPPRILATAMRLKEQLPEVEFLVHHTVQTYAFQFKNYEDLYAPLFGTMPTALFDIYGQIVEVTNTPLASSDPFLEALCGEQRAFIEVWDEADFQAELP